MVFEHTIDWETFWREASDREQVDASPGAVHVPDLLPEFFAARGVPDSFADVGCGRGTVVFDVSRRYPETTVVGYDAARSVLEANRRRECAGGDDPRSDDGSRSDARRPVENLRFERAVLPRFEPNRSFDVVFSHCTLCYVAEIDRALQSLYEAVAPGGTLVLGYVSEHARQQFQDRFDDSGSSLKRFDPAERFELVLEGESVLSYRRIHDVLGIRPRSVWDIVEKPDAQWAWRNVPLVWVPKPEDTPSAPAANR